MRRAAAIFAIVALTISCSTYGPTFAGDSSGWPAGNSQHSVSVNSLTRTFVIHVPSHKRTNSAGVTVPWPLVIVFHGSSGDAGTIEHQSGMDSLADAQRFLVAYPNGTGGTFGLYPSDWNAGTCCGAANRDGVDDLGFVDELIGEVSLHLPLDVHRVYAAGFSSGAYMAYHAGCQLSASIAAIGVVEGALADYSCSPAKPMPLFAIHGTSDPEVSYTEDSPPPGGPVPLIAAGLPPSIRYWAWLNGCAAKTAKGTSKNSSADVQLVSLTFCTKADVNFFTIQGGTHGWPDGPDDPGDLAPMNELHASSLMWTFFIAHRR